MDPPGTQAWVLEIPDALEAVQRRAAYRLRDWMNPPLKIHLWAVGGTRPAILECEVVDLSSSGIGLAVPKAAAMHFPIERKVGLSLVLENGQRPLVLKGEVCSRRPRPGRKTVKVGVAFVDALKVTGYSTSFSLLTRYVTEQERLHIQRERADE